MTFFPAGSEFVDAQRYGALLIDARFTVYEAGVPTGTPYYSAVSDGNFTIDRNSEFRRSGQITIEVIPILPPPPLVPANPDSLLAPFGNELFIETGIAAVGNTTSKGSKLKVNWLANGLFVIATSTVDDTTIDMTVTLDLYDRSWTIAQRALLAPYNFPATATGNFVEEIKKLLNFVWATNQQGFELPGQPLQYNIVPTSQVVPIASYDQGSDPWQAAQDMAAAVGYELYFDPAGMVVGKPIPNALTSPLVWNFTDDSVIIAGLGGTGSTALFGDAYSTPVEISVKMTRDGIYNHIIIQGTGDANAATYNGAGIETAGSPILAQAFDDNPVSPTYIDGPLGDIPNFVTSSLVTQAGAQGMANNDLQVALSSAWQMTLAAAPNPIFDVDDCITVTRPRVGLNNARVVLDTITQTFNYSDQMQLTGRILSSEAPLPVPIPVAPPTPPPPPSPYPSGLIPPPIEPGYGLDLFEDFLGTDLDGALWSRYSGVPGGTEANPGWWEPSHAVVGASEASVLDLQLYQDPSAPAGTTSGTGSGIGGENWVGGGIGLNPSAGVYGPGTRIRVAMRADSGVEWASAIALLIAYVGYPPEIDFFETIWAGTDPVTSFNATAHYGVGNLQLPETWTASGGDSVSNWHTWGVNWTDTQIEYTVQAVGGPEVVWATTPLSGPQNDPTDPYSLVQLQTFHLQLQTPDETYSPPGHPEITAEHPVRQQIDWVQISILL